MLYFFWIVGLLGAVALTCLVAYLIDKWENFI